ncbi:DUF3592 domain-containing protein [Roseiflexus castenholzii]|jgi:hypothetical protein|uniref:DUF3592 domain-containing protein n=1 Tax=Roseiflexus castenholzii (strain DSM 13941 / HLO8) TaxID=383372 RepID=A7NNB3_ROSCS|nr:DUF3592 domain-containing protein [Roseiflexus castenholzii]ABU59046.1 conserved hypothetical protein [Roseiflexus castenholzii DSM 13941]
MSGEVLFVLLFCALPLVIGGLVAFGFIQRMYHFQEILADGVETDALVVRKYRSVASLGNRHRLVYEYRDASGKTYRKDDGVFPSEYDRLQEGDAFRVVYSAKRPHISTTKAAVDQSRATQAGEAEKQRE